MEVIDNPSAYPDPARIAKAEEPFVDAHIYTPNDYVGPLMDLCQHKRGTLIAMDYLDETRVDLHYQIPLGEIVYDFFDAIKSRSRGYASYDYAWEGWHQSELVKLDIPAERRDRGCAFDDRICGQRLRQEAPHLRKAEGEYPAPLCLRFPFRRPSAARSSRETVKAVRKDVFAKCYGGDITRKKKLLEKQKAGKKKMRKLGSVTLPSEAFTAVLKLDSDT